MKIINFSLVAILLSSSLFGEIDYRNYEFGNEDNEKPNVIKVDLKHSTGVTRRIPGQRKGGQNITVAALERLKASKIERLEAKIECIEDAPSQTDVYNCGI